MSNNRIISNVVVLGGGTAGWLTALYAKNNLPTKSITVIESEEIGILGAGEGSTPHLLTLLDGLGIPVSRLIKETKSTVKSAIKFTNWNNGGDKDYYFHSFAATADLDLENACVSPYLSSAPSLLTGSLAVDDSIYTADFIKNICEKNKVPFVYDKNLFVENQDRILDYYAFGEFSIHFDASEMAKTLREIALERGVVRVEGIVDRVVQDETGDVKTLILESGIEVNSDFIFDCSGFARFFPKFFNSEWKSYSNHLPVDTAIPFFLTMDEENIPPYTEAIAMKYGWMWKIPLQHRYGCGYVFDSSLITEEEAKKEIEEYLGHSISSPRTIKFSPGRYETPWVNNVVSVGLSSSFIEPLEATSIWISIFYMKEILANPEVMHIRDQNIVDDFNKYLGEVNDSVLDFVYFHYMSGRNDTEFWSSFNYENAPEGLKKYLNIMKYRALRPRDMAEGIWDVFSWYRIAFGINYPKVREYAEDSDFYNYYRDRLRSNYLVYKAHQEELSVIHCSSHYDFLKNLKEELNES